jgi:two-component system sensor histidine kinase VicK
MRRLSKVFKKLRRMTSTLQVKLVFIFVLISIVLMIAASVALIYSVESSYYTSFMQRVDKGLESWGLSEEPQKEEILDFFVNNKKDAFLILGITEYKTIYVVEANTSEIIITNEEFGVSDRAGILNDLLSSQNYLSAIVGDVGDKGSLNYSGDKVYFDYALKKGDFILYFKNYREEWQGTLNEFNRIIKYSFIFAIIFSSVTGFFLSKAITIPIKKLMGNARRIAAGDFERLLNANSKDEIGLLTSSFNHMAVQLKNKLFEISNEKNKIETIINYIDDGIIAYNRNGEVIHANQCAKDIYGKENTFLPFNDFCEKFKIHLSLNDLLEYQFNLDKEDMMIHIEELIIRLRTAVFKNKKAFADGVIFVFQDVTEEKLLDNMRKEFVANVSHEIRTPLTSIKSYTETLLEGEIEDDKTAKKFLGIVITEVDRMTKLVKDLLMLSKVDSKQMNWEMNIVQLDQVINNTMEMFRIEAEKKKHCP